MVNDVASPKVVVACLNEGFLLLRSANDGSCWSVCVVDVKVVVVDLKVVSVS